MFFRAFPGDLWGSAHLDYISHTKRVLGRPLPIANAEALVDTLTALPAETEWVEFKRNRFEPDEVGQYVSALANAAMLNNQRVGYLIYGVEDATHAIVGTTVDLRREKIGGEAFINWLVRKLDPKLNVEIEEGLCQGRRVVVIAVDPAWSRPVKFGGVAYVRNGPHKKLLSDFPEKERTLWQVTSRFTFEHADAVRHMTGADVAAALDLDRFFTLAQEPRPISEASLLDRLQREGLVRSDLQARYDLSNLAALTLARDLDVAPALKRKRGIR